MITRTISLFLVSFILAAAAVFTQTVSEAASPVLSVVKGMAALPAAVSVSEETPVSQKKDSPEGAIKDEVITEEAETEREVKEEEEEEIEEPERGKRKYLISPDDIISVVVEKHTDYNRIVLVQSNGSILYPPLGEIPAVNLTAEQLSNEIAVGLSRSIYKPQVKVAVKYRVELGKPEKYLIKPGDVVDITVEGIDEYDQTMVVQPNGKILYLPLGEIRAAGMNIPRLTNNVRLGLSNLTVDPQVNINIKQFEELPEEIARPEMEIPLPVQRFGHDFFTGARNRILKLEDQAFGSPRVRGDQSEKDSEEMPTPSTISKDAILGFVGPADMMGANVAATVPSKYVLAPGDKLNIHFWSDIEVDIQTMSLVVDQKGEVMVPKAGKIVVRGMTLEQFEEAIRELLSRVAYKNLKLIATLDSLRSIQVFITGEAFRPGSYAVSVVTTMFNALYMCGGPSDNGSLRNIKLLRDNKTRSVDFYKFLMDGDSSQDYSLDGGDIIFIPQVGRIVTISGEVKRPAIYELREGENLLDLISLAGGIRPSGFLQRVQIDSVRPGRERIVLDINISDNDQADAPIFDGDTVMVFSIPSERMNTVTIEGKVRMPGVYQLKEGMKVSDLIRAAQGIRGEAYTERADLLRFNIDRKTTRLMPINLSKALAGENTDDVALEQWDRLVVYSKWDVKWIADRVVNVHGAVQHPGSYERSDNMTVADLLMQAGDVLPNAYLDRALLMRLDERGEMTRSIPLDLRGSEAARPAALPGKDLKLEDGDTLVVYTHQAARWEPKREVTIEGSVQNPNVFSRVDDMKVSDLIHRAGGLLPDAYPDRALLLRLDNRQRVTQGFFISPELALQDDPKNNLELKDGDRLKIYTYQEAVWEPERKVTIVGAVHRPGTVPMIKEPGIAEAEFEETPTVIEELLEENQMGTVPRTPEETETALVQSDSQSIKESLSEVPPKESEQILEEGTAIKLGSIFERIDGMRVSDLVYRAGGLLPNAYPERADLRRFRPDHETYITIPVNLAKVLAGDKEADVLLQDEDVLTVYTIGEAEYKPDNIVTIYGAVQRPDVYIRAIGMKLSDLVFAAGGLLPSAHKDAEITRIDENGKILIRTVDITALLEGDESQDILLEDGDVVSIRRDNEFLDVLRIVTIEGQVKYPGRYTLKHNEKLSDLIERAGGLLDRAYPEASVITRKEEYLTMEEQRQSVQQVKELLDILSDKEYQREVAKARLIEERHRDQDRLSGFAPSVTPTTTIETYLPVATTAVSEIPEQAGTAISEVEEITRSQYTLVTPARKIDKLIPTGRVVVNVREAMDYPGGKNDIILEDGDEIMIPAMPFTISVSGAVIQPSSLIYIKGKKVKDYIRMVGGYARDADKEAVYTVKPNGMVLTGDNSDLDPGDMIVVPTKVEVQKITDRWGQVIGALKFIATTIATVYTIKLILERV